MITDIRAIVYCNLGKVISGNFSDSFIQGSGVVTTNGSVILDGIYSLTPGQKVQFAYYKNGRVSRLPRSLRVLSFFADPFRRTTTVELGCAFTLFANKKPPAKATSQEENPELPCDDFKKYIVPISANFILSKCFSALGLSRASVALTNVFNVEEFDLSAGYVQVISDLLVSEGYFCYLDEAEKAVVVNLNSVSSAGPLIAGNQLLDLGPVGVGQLPGDGVVVRYNSLRLKPPTPEDPETDEEIDTLIRDWELDTSSVTGGKVYVTAWEVIEVVSGGIGFSGRDWIRGWRQTDYEYPDFTITETRSSYDQWNRVTERRTVTQRPVAAVNPSYIQSYINNVVFKPRISFVGDIIFGELPSGTTVCEEVQVEYYFYEKNPAEPLPEQEGGSCTEEEPPGADEGFDSLIRKETLKYDSLIKVLGSVWQGSYYEPVLVTENTYEYIDWIPLQLTADDFMASILVEKVIETYDKQETSVPLFAEDGRSVIGKDIITKQITERYINSVYTREGQRAIANATSVSIFAYNSKTVAGAIQKMKTELSFDVRTINQTIGRNAFVESRPSRSARIKTATRKDNEPETEQVAEIAFAGANSDSETYVELSMPYAPEDTIQRLSDGSYVLVKSNVAAKALNFGRVQNRLLVGSRYGISIQISADIMPPRPFDPIYIDAGGYRGQYRLNGTSYTFDSSGIVASTDALFWGGLQA